MLSSGYGCNAARRLGGVTAWWRLAPLVLAFGGLQWGDVELDRGRIPVRRQPYGESGEFRAPKTKSGVRFVPLLPRVTSELRGHANVAVTLSVYTHWVESHASSDHTSKLEA